MDDDSKLAEKLRSILPYLNERQQRWLLAATALKAQEHSISHQLVNELLHSMGYSLQGNAKTLEGEHSERDHWIPRERTSEIPDQ